MRTYLLEKMNRPDSTCSATDESAEEPGQKTTVIGSGLMARAFAELRLPSDVVVFASGVSNSLEADPAKFKRERDLLESTQVAYPGCRIVYFSTCSIFDRDRVNTPYVRHKLEMESFLAGLPNNHIVLRLPLVIGKTNYASTLPHVLYARIKSGEAFEVWKNATRYPIDIADVVCITQHLLEDTLCVDKAINIAFRAYPVMDFVRVLESIIGKCARVKLVDKGASYYVPCQAVESLIQRLHLFPGENYLKMVLEKYFAG